MDVKVGLWRRLSAEELMLWTVVLEKTLESPLDCKEIQPVHSEGDQPWVFFGRTDDKAEAPVLWPSCEELTDWKRLWCWEGLGAGGEGDDRGWDGRMASRTRWMWLWMNSRRWWWTGRPGVLRFMGLQRVRHNWVTELNWDLLISFVKRLQGNGIWEDGPVLSQVSGKFLRQATKGGSLVHAGKYSRASHSKAKAEIHIPWSECRPSEKVRACLGCRGG